jgi:hypothetical protein
MSQARLSDPQVIRDFRVRLSTFLGACAAGLGGVPGDYAHAQDWLRGQYSHWKKQLQRRTEAYTTARLAYLEAEADVRASRSGRGGGRQSSDDERRLMNRNARLRDEAQEKVTAVQRWMQVLEQDVSTLVHQCQGHDLALREQGALALTQLDRLADQVDTYLDIKPGSTSPLPAWPGTEEAAPTPPPAPLQTETG